MPFPKRPRGEKPTVTIRWQRRQMNLMEQRITLLLCDIEERKKNEARADVEKSEADDRIVSLQLTIEGLEESDRNAAAIIAPMTRRLAYLEGYYAKSAETLTYDQAQIVAAAGARNPNNLPYGEETREIGRQEAIAERARRRARDEIRRGEAHNPSYQERGSVEGLEVETGRDGMPQWFHTR